MLGNLLLVALGGALGSAGRWLVTLAALRAFGPGLPLGTLAVNIAGSFAMGLCAQRIAQGSPQAMLMMTGMLGGFTTFSAFSLDAFALWDRGATGLAAAYVLGSVILSLAALVLGIATARALP
jgi:CrcB protein